MLRPLPDLPDGVIGFEAVGEVHADDYRQVLRPAIEAATTDGGKVRLVYVLGPEFHGYSVGAGWEDTTMGVHHLSAFERSAVVTDVEWVEHLVAGFGWMVPGELRRFPLDQRDAAVRWAAGQPEPAATAAPEGGDVVAGGTTGTVGEEAAPEPPAVPEPVTAAAPEPAATPVTVEPAPAAAEPAPERPAEPTVETPAAVAGMAAVGGPQTVTPRAPMAPGADMRPGMAQPTPPQAPSVPAQWAPDPSGRHHHRWWDGHQWTGHVADNGVSSFDPIA